MINGPDVQRLLAEARVARDRARGVLAGLMLHPEAEPDALHRATGESSTQRAIHSTRQILETLERSIAELERCVASNGPKLRVETVRAGSDEPTLGASR
ncbi:MAG: hypothetical protein AAGK04_10285 [Planctomycetota bacterium]